MGCFGQLLAWCTHSHCRTEERTETCTVEYSTQKDMKNYSIIYLYHALSEEIMTLKKIKNKNLRKYFLVYTKIIFLLDPAEVKKY